MSELFLKDKLVITFRDVGGEPMDIKKVEAPELLPLCLRSKCTMDNVRTWLKKRGMPDKREGLDDMKAEFGDRWLHPKNYLSLTDQYWIRKRTETWKRINFFTNFYSPDIGDMAFKPWTVSGRKINSASPDLTTGGILKKRWLQKEDKTSMLIKASSRAAHQDPLNEVLVSVLTEKLGVVKSAGYDLWIEGTQMCSRCDNFVNENTELVPASYIYFEKPRDEKNENVYTHLLRMCDLYEIEGAKDYIDWVIFIDSLTGNEDRHLTNIAFLRDVNTLKFIGPSPLFDCGNAYWNAKKINGGVKSKLFGDVEEAIVNTRKEMCDLKGALSNEGVHRLIQDYPGLSDERKDALTAAITERNLRMLNNQAAKFYGV